MRLTGRNAIVTGAGSGIGRASAVLFAKEGAFVALVDRDRAGLQERLTAIEGDKGQASVHAGDVSEADFAQTVVSDVMARRGRLDVLTAAAGFSCGGTVLTTDPADWDAVFRTNVGGTWLWSRAAVPEMQRRGGGSIITLASQLAIAGGKGNSAYIAAKGAIGQLTYGTGTAPVNGAANTGTQVGNYAITGATASTGYPFAISAIVSGLTPRTADWFDTNLAALTGGTASVQNLTCSALEL
jgi:NAD(P)-dependent dehydrogenase (short-subunit alcohol dehydrogenase family)